MTAHPETPRLGYIGLGNQGAPMAKRLLDWPGGLTVFDVRVEAMAPFVEQDLEPMRQTHAHTFSMLKFGRRLPLRSR